MSVSYMKKVLMTARNNDGERDTKRRMVGKQKREIKMDIYLSLVLTVHSSFFIVVW